MEKFFRDLASRAATIDELLGPEFEPAPADKSTTDLSARRLAAWCRSCANGDWAQFGRRLAPQGWQFDQVLTRFSAARQKPSAAAPQWLIDAVWIDREMRAPIVTEGVGLSQSRTSGAYPFLELT